jgi:phospholipase C
MDIMVLGSTKIKTVISLTAGRPSNTRWKNAVCGDAEFPIFNVASTSVVVSR